MAGWVSRVVFWLGVLVALVGLGLYVAAGWGWAGLVAGVVVLGCGLVSMAADAWGAE